MREQLAAGQAVAGQTGHERSAGEGAPTRAIERRDDGSLLPVGTVLASATAGGLVPDNMAYRLKDRDLGRVTPVEN